MGIKHNSAWFITMIKLLPVELQHGTSNRHATWHLEWHSAKHILLVCSIRMKSRFIQLLCIHNLLLCRSWWLFTDPEIQTAQFYIHYKILEGWKIITQTGFKLKSLTTTVINMLAKVRFQVLGVASMNMIAFWDIMLCSLVEVDQRFRSAYCLLHQGPDSGGSIHLWDTRFFLQHYRGAISQENDICIPAEVWVAYIYNKNVNA